MEIDKKAKEYLKLLLDEGAKTPINDEDLNVEVPSFYDEKKFKRAQQFFKENMFIIMGCMFSGLIAILASPSVLDLLIFTKASSAPVTAYRRYTATVFHTLNWFRYDLTPGTKCWKSLEAVKRLHSRASRGAKKANVGFISQKDMAVTQFGFIGFVMLKWKQISITYNRDDFEAFIHFWRVIGHILNIEERFNVCTDSLDESLARLDVILTRILQPSLIAENEKFEKMTRAIVDGLWVYNSDLEYEPYMFLVNWLCGMPNYTYGDHPSAEEKAILQKMNWLARFKLWFGMVIIGKVLLKIQIFRIYYNWKFLILEFMIRHFPVLAVWQFGWKHAFVKV